MKEMTISEKAGPCWTLVFLLLLYPPFPRLFHVPYQKMSLNSHILTLSLRRADLPAGDPNQIQPTSVSLFLLSPVEKAEVEKATDA